MWAEDAPDPRLAEVATREERLRVAARRRDLLDDVPHGIGAKKPKVAYMAAQRRSEKGKAKQLEKELCWGMIPPEEKELSKRPRHPVRGACRFWGGRPLSLEESARVLREVDLSRILSSRFAYKDKNHAKRKEDPSIAPKPKARLCVSGQHDPDLGKIDMSTDAPTANRHSVLLALQLGLADGLPAFLNGVPAPRQLYFRQPKRGIPSLAPGQLVEIVKGVFGLSTSPKLWWMKLSGDLKAMRVQGGDEELRVEQNTIGPCVFMLVGCESERVRGLLLIYVDDLLLTTEGKLRNAVQDRLKELFPVDDWEEDSFEYVGCEYVCGESRVTIHQKNYAHNRVDKVTIRAGQRDEDPADADQIEENRTSIGSASWLAKQTRPDLQFQVAQAQRRQNSPTVKDLKATNLLVQAVREQEAKGLTLRRVPEHEMVLLAYHAAAWGNVDCVNLTPEDQQWNGEFTLASQLASLVLVCEKKCLYGQPGQFGVIDWKSKASQRVCRSTFAGETMACSDALESAIFLRGLMASFMTGRPVPEKQCGELLEIHLVTDCKSLYDHVQREGTPKAPSEKRLAIDLASIRQLLVDEAMHQWRRLHGDAGSPSPDRPLRAPLHWLPTEEQLADMLTKKMKAEAFWKVMDTGVLSLPLLEPCWGQRKHRGF